MLRRDPAAMLSSTAPGRNMWCLLARCLLIAPLSIQGERRTLNAPVEPGTSRAWALATTAVIFERNGGRHDLLAGAELNDATEAEAVALLKDDWGIETTEHVDNAAGNLFYDGNRTYYLKEMKELSKLNKRQFEQRLEAEKDPFETLRMKALREHAPRALAMKGGLLAWDSCRMIALYRWGFCAGYYTEEEAWTKIDPIARELQKGYASWEELGEAYFIGRECWLPNTNADTLEALEKLKKDPKSPFKTTPWNLKLGRIDKPEKRAPAKK